MSKKSKKKARKAAKRAANKNAILKKDKQDKPLSKTRVSPFPNFTAQTDNRKSNFKYIQPKTKVKRLVVAPTQSALKELWDSLDVEELQRN